MYPNSKINLSILLVIFLSNCKIEKEYNYKNISGVWSYNAQSYTGNYFLIDKKLFDSIDGGDTYSYWTVKNDSLYVWFNNHDYTRDDKYAELKNSDTITIHSDIYQKLTYKNDKVKFDSIKITHENYCVTLISGKTYTLYYKLNAEYRKLDSFLCNGINSFFINEILTSFSTKNLKKQYKDHGPYTVNSPYTSYIIFSGEHEFNTIIQTSKNAHPLEILRGYLLNLIYEKRKLDAEFINQFFLR